MSKKYLVRGELFFFGKAKPIEYSKNKFWWFYLPCEL